jgi:hypothetical protein
VPHPALHRHSRLPLLPEPPSATAPSTIAGLRPTPRSRLHELSLTKVRGGIGCPRAPLHFAPPPDRRHAPGRRRAPPLHRSATVNPRPCLDQEGGEVEEGHFAHTPCPFPTFPNRTPLYSLSPFFKIRPYTLNYTTKTTLSLYNYTPGLFSKTLTRSKYYN